MTVGAKRYYFAEANLPAGMRDGRVQGAIEGLVILLGILSLGWVLLVFFGGRLLAGVFVLFAATFFVAYWQELPGALGWNEYRYLYPFLPWLLAGFAAALGSRRQRLASLRLVRAAVPYILVVGLAATLVDVPGAGPNTWHSAAKQETALAAWRTGATNTCRQTRRCWSTTPATSPTAHVSRPWTWSG